MGAKKKPNHKCTTAMDRLQSIPTATLFRSELWMHAMVNGMGSGYTLYRPDDIQIIRKCYSVICTEYYTCDAIAKSTVNMTHTL